MLLLCALVVGSGSAWADDVAVASFSRSGTTNTTTGGTFSTTFSAKSGYYQDNTGTCYMKIFSESAYWTTTPASITLTSSIGGGSGNKDLSNAVYAVLLDSNGNEIPSSDKSITSHITTAGGDSYTTSIPVTNNVYGIKLYHDKESGYNVRYYSFTLSYTPSGGDTPTTYTVTYNANGGTGTMTDENSPYEADAEVTLLANGFTAPTGFGFNGWAVTDGSSNPIEVTNNKFTMPASNVTVTAQWQAYTITAQSNNDNYGSVELNGFVITASPNNGYRYANPVYTVDPANSANVEQNGNKFTVTPTANTTVTINFEAIPIHTATFSVNGETTTQDYIEGAEIVFPANPAAISGKSFVGWVTEAIDGTTNTAPSYVTSATMGTSDVTYYAVFADVEDSTTPTNLVINTETENFPTSYGTANTFTEYTLNGKKFKIQQGYINEEKLQWRAAGNTNGTGIIYNSEAINKIQSVVIVYDENDNNKNFTLNVGTSENPTSGTSITPSISNGLTYTFDCSSGNYDYFVLTNGSYAGYLTSITINYLTGSFTYTNYCTTVVAPAVEKPVITVAENPFQISTTATITCETAGATIKYSFDGETWNDYSEALTITSTTTIYAKAEKDGDVSAIASVTATKELVETLVYIYDYEITNDAVNINNGEAGRLLASVAAYNADEEDYDVIDGKTVTWSSDDDEIATINPRTGEVTLVGVGEVTFTATYAGDNYYEGSTATYPLTVVNRYDVTLPEGDDYGTYEMDVDNPVAVGEEVTLTYTPATGYENYQATWSVNGTPISDNKFEMPAEAVTVTVAVAEVVDYATLPFAFNGGKADIENTYGLTQEGLDSDYASSPKLKFNSAGDWLILNFNERPGKLTFDIKGNSFSGGTFKVQTSEDGENYTDLETYTNLINSNVQSEEFNNLGENVRYIKWVYAVKDNGNVGLGNIGLTSYSPVPSITVAPATIAVEDAEEHDGTLDLSYANLTINDMDDFGIQYYDAEGEETTEPDWIEVLVAEQDPSIGDGYVVSYYMLENEGEARTAYFKVFALGTTDYVFSNKVTITQAAYVAPAVPGNWIETPLADINANDVFVIVGNNGDTYAMSNDKGTSNAPDAVDITVVGSTLSGTIADNIKWNISGDNDCGYTFYPNGTTETWLYCINDNNGVRVGTNNNKTFTISDDGYLCHIVTSRYIGIYNSQDWRCYTSTTGNIAGQTFTFYKQLAAKLNAYGYGTFSATVPVDFSEATDFTAWAITGIDGTSINFSQITGAVPAGTGVLLKGTANEFVYPATATSGTFTGTNLLEAVTAAKVIQANKYYGLNGNTFKKVGEGTVPAGKALLPVSAVTGSDAGSSRLTFVFEDATGIATIEHSPLTIDRYYDMQGRRVDNPKKGMYIVNGKKVVMK